MDDFTVLDDVALPFQAQKGVGACLREAAGAKQVVELYHLGADEAFGQVGVDFGGRFERGCARADSPGAAFVLADGEKRNQAEQMIA